MANSSHPKIVAFLQARYSSTRLPGKVLKEILGRPMLLRQIERLSLSRHLEKLVVVTSEEPSDDLLADTLTQNSVPVVRGSLNDVLDRFYKASLQHPSSITVRLTGDCPLADPSIIDQTIDFHLAGDFDYTSNNNPPTFPDGLDCEVFSTEKLKYVWETSKLPSEREHVTPYFYKHPELFKIGKFHNTEDLSTFRWTVDEPEDFKLVTEIYSALYPKNKNFGLSDILQFLKDKPELLKLNSHFTYNEGYLKSLKKDAGQD